MRVQHNIMAMGAYRNYTNNVSAMKKNLERLSSGYRINRAGDDAAGLAISEKMRAQITGLETAQKNAKDGISLVQTAEGALQEVHDMLNRMVELATQSANGTYNSETDRVQLQKEVDQLKEEIDRIADSANFNGISLLDGSMTSVATVIPGKAEVLEGAATKAGKTFFGSTEVTNSVLDAGDGNYILHRKDNGAGGTEFEINLTGIKFDSLSSGGSTLTISIGGTTFNVTGIGLSKTGVINTDELISSIKDALGTIGININGVTFTVIDSEDSTAIRFKMDELQAKTLTNAASFAGNFEVKIDVTYGAGTNGGVLTGGYLTASGNISIATSNITQGQPAAGEVYANVSQKDAFTATDIKDGSTVKVGNEYYIFALTDDGYGKALSAGNMDSKYKVVDLRDLVKEDGSELDTSKFPTALETALARLSEVAKDNEMFVVGVSDGKELTFRERAGFSSDTVDLTKLEDSKDGTIKGLASQFAWFKDGLTIEETVPSRTVNGKSLTLQIGDTADGFNQLKVDISDMHVNAIGIGGVDISDQVKAQEAIDQIKAAINTVSDVRGTLGATQNRLEHTINNLSVMTENIQDAESTIRDTDIAEEMMAYTKNNILIQASQAMLAQANQVPQGVLQLLQ